MLKALYEVVSKAGKSMSDASRTSIFTLSESGFNDPDGGCFSPLGCSRSII